jgi:hypothetical protein
MLCFGLSSPPRGHCWETVYTSDQLVVVAGAPETVNSGPASLLKALARLERCPFFCIL